jgi:Na+/melibiose symporter-like transporter
VSQSQSGPAGGQISLPRALVFASAAVPIGALGVAATVHLPRYFAAELGLSLALVGTVFALVRFIDIPIDTAMGLAMDRTKTRFGRYRVWMALGAPVLMLGFYMLLMTGTGDGPLYLGLWLLVMYLGYSGVLLSHLAWAGRLAPTYKERSRIFGAITGLGVIGAIAVLVIPILMSQQGYTDAQGVQAMIWFIIVVTAVTCMLVVFSSPERITQDRPAKFTLKDYAQLLTRGNVIRLLPPLNATTEELARSVEIFRAVLKAKA